MMLISPISWVAHWTTHARKLDSPDCFLVTQFKKKIYLFLVINTKFACFLFIPFTLLAFRLYWIILQSILTNICITGPQWVIPREVHVLAGELSILITYLVVHTIKWGLCLHVYPYYIPWNMHADCCAVLLWFYYQSQIVWEWFTHILEGCSHGQLCDCLSAHEVILNDMGKNSFKIPIGMSMFDNTQTPISLVNH